MKRILLAVLAIALALPLAAEDHAQYIVVLRDEKARAAVAAEARSLGARVDAELPQRIVITASATVAGAVRQNAGVRYVQQAVAGPADVAIEPERPAHFAAATMAVEADSVQTWTTGDYAYDGMGNITAIGTAASPGTRGTRTYTYDVLSRLENVQISGSYPNWPYAYTYDLYGNRTAELVNGQAMPVNVDPAKNRLTDATYDERGNQLARGLTKAAFDGFDMITRYDFDGLNSLSYVYTAADERIGVLRGTEWTWSLRGPDGKVLRQYASSSTVRTAAWLWIEDYVYRDGLLLGGERVPEEGGRRHFHLDHLGSARLVTSASGALMSEHEFLPFGAERTPIRQHIDRGHDREEPLRFTGHERDFDIARAAPTSASIDYMHARYYVANTGRFLSVDPTWDSALLSRPQSWNRYSYVLNNPVNMTDPDGRVWWQVVAGGVGAGAAVVLEGARQTYRVVVHGEPADNRKLATAAAGGFVSGFMVGTCPTCGGLGTMALGAVGNAAGGTTTRMLDGEETTATDVIVDAATGALGARVGQAGGGRVVAASEANGTLSRLKMKAAAQRAEAAANNTGLGADKATNQAITYTTNALAAAGGTSGDAVTAAAAGSVNSTRDKDKKKKD